MDKKTPLPVQETTCRVTEFIIIPIDLTEYCVCETNRQALRISTLGPTDESTQTMTINMAATVRARFLLLRLSPPQWRNKMFHATHAYIRIPHVIPVSASRERTNLKAKCVLFLYCHGNADVGLGKYRQNSIATMRLCYADKQHCATFANRYGCILLLRNPN